MYRMQQREMILALSTATLRCARCCSIRPTLIARTVFAAHTHTQPAQPSTIAHYLHAVVEQLERDTRRLRPPTRHESQSARRLRDHRHRLSDRSRPHERAPRIRRPDRQHLRQHCDGRLPARERVRRRGAARRTRPHRSGPAAVVHARVRYLRLADEFVQSSSIMPQKRNPVALEHARAISSKALGQASAILLTVHNTPFGDIVDTEDDLQPLVFVDVHRRRTGRAARGRRDGDRAFDREPLAERAEQGWITVTELADTLTRDKGVPFKTSHAIATRFVAEADKRPSEPRRASCAMCRWLFSARRSTTTNRRSPSFSAPVISSTCGTCRVDRRRQKPGARSRGPGSCLRRMISGMTMRARNSGARMRASPKQRRASERADG